MATGFDKGRDRLTEMFFATAQKEVRRLCSMDRRVDEQAAMDVATDCVMKLVEKVEGMRLVENYAQVSIRRRLDEQRRRGRLGYNAHSIGDSLNAAEIDFADVDANSEIEEMEMAEYLVTVTTAEERDLLDTRGVGLSGAEKKRLSRLRQRLEENFAANLA